LRKKRGAGGRWGGKRGKKGGWKTLWKREVWVERDKKKEPSNRKPTNTVRGVKYRNAKEKSQDKQQRSSIICKK